LLPVEIFNDNFHVFMVRLNLVPCYPFAQKQYEKDKPMTTSLVRRDMANPIEPAHDVAGPVSSVDSVTIFRAPIGETLQGMVLVSTVREVEFHISRITLFYFA
jgi:hypothetical protein